MLLCVFQAVGTCICVVVVKVVVVVGVDVCVCVCVCVMFSKFEQSLQFSFDCSFHWEYSYTLHMIPVLVLFNGYVVI